MHLIVGHVLDAGVGGQFEAAQPVSAPVTVRTLANPRSSLLADRIREAIPANADELIYEFVLEQVVAVLKLDASQPPGSQQRLLDLGFDSLMAVQLRNRLGAGLSLYRPLPASLLFDYPTIEALSRIIFWNCSFRAKRETAAKTASRADLG